MADNRQAPRARWITISDDLQVRLREGKPQFHSRQRQTVSLEQAMESVSFWTRSHESVEADAWLEAAEEEVDIDKRVGSWLSLCSLAGIPVTVEEARAQVIRQRKYEAGLKAFDYGDYEEALKNLKPLAESGHRAAQFRLGVICARGAGRPRDYVQAYIWFALAAKGHVDLAPETRDRIAECLSPEELMEAKRRAEALDANL